MNNKFFIVLLATAIIVGSWVFFATNSSYQEALQSKFYYEIGNYKKAHELAQKAYEKDIYNKMANTVMKQSQIALKYTRYIEEANEYLEQILKISKSSEVSKVDTNRIRIMCEIVIEGYDKLKPSTLTPKDIQDEAKDMRDKFVKLKEELFKEEI
ncbi:hypothetical protein [Campylobacter sp. RM16188]|uniref:hypothetical protein n=1 Tax=Campylobacter sp. RM16188 TaxID=1705725 RepID=UPI0015526469|nr:hypothetical protein [Campylobacter sp. RM16188]